MVPLKLAQDPLEGRDVGAHIGAHIVEVERPRNLWLGPPNKMVVKPSGRTELVVTREHQVARSDLYHRRPGTAVDEIGQPSPEDSGDHGGTLEYPHLIRDGQIVEIHWLEPEFRKECPDFGGVLESALL